ncbi:hypothetical protein BDV93DRAFT_179855 [Ceratobasidium sp. AG-I]|nr:hypothetical protein BDV93DRAFT_179855 [Ceratobasidium sp. AG-I]
MPATAKDIVDAHLANSGLDPDARSPTPEPTTQSGITPGNALYDSPDEGSQPAEFRTGRRQRRSTERGGSWVENRRRSEDIRKKGNRTRKINSARRAHEGAQTSQDPSSQVQSRSQSNGVPPSHAEPQPGPLPKRQRRGKSGKARQISRSPTPGSTDHELEETTHPATTDSQYTFIYETLDHEGLVQYARENHGVDGRNCDTQTLLTKIRVAQMQQTAQVEPPRQPPSIKPLPGRPLQVGGGWHLEFPASYRPESHGSKRGAGVSQQSGSSKRLRLATDEWDDTATEPETDEDPIEYRKRNFIKNVLGPPLTSLRNQHLDPSQPSAPGTHGPPPSQNFTAPSRESTPTTVPAIQPTRSVIGVPSHSHYGKSTTPTSPIPQIPNLVLPLRGPTHARLRDKQLEAYLNYVDPNEEDADVQAVTDEETDQLAPMDDEVAHETDLDTRSRPQRTYNRARTHLPSRPPTNPPEHDNAAGPAPRSDSTGLDRSQAIRKTREQAVVTKTMANVRAMMRGPVQAYLAGKSTAPPLTRSQPRPPLARAQGSRRLDPASNARNDMIAFNEAVARREATSFVQSATRPTKRTTRNVEPSSRPLHELLDDDEEVLAQAEAFAKMEWPPLARDVSGVHRQVLILAKIHLLAYALVQGVYQTRATYLRWAESVYFATWNMELPTTHFERPEHEYFEIMVNSIATLRGKVKERLRPFTAMVAGFQHCTTDQEVIQENLRKFNLIYPNSFHCKSYSPRKGHYEHPEIGHCIAVALFHGPGSVGVMFPDYFTDMPLTVAAFALALWLFCIEEWSRGWHQNGDLGMAAMREKYESQLAGLKALRAIAPLRMEKLQKEWCKYVMEYSGAMLTHKDTVPSEDACQSEMRPDTPEFEADDEAWEEARAQVEAPTQIQANDAISVEDMNACLLETGRQASLQKRAREIAAREELENDPDIPMDEDDDEDADPHAPTPSPVEYNPQGRLTASSKGKALAN